jgi:membrane protein DedA with SNARE-associated domain
MTRFPDGPLASWDAPLAGTLYHWLADFFSRYGYWVVFFGVMLENAGLPVPGETVLLFAGFLSFQGKLELRWAVLTAIAGATIGDSLGYMLGRLGGTFLLKKYRGSFLLSAGRFDRAQAVFLKYGHWAVFVARFITGLRVLAGPFAGAFRMEYRRFLFFNFTGAVLWAITIGCVGYVFGGNWGRLIRLLKEFDVATLIVLGIVAAFFFYRSRRRAKD